MQDPQYLREKARKARAMAQQMSLSDAYKAMMIIAAHYEYLTEVAEWQQASTFSASLVLASLLRGQ